MDKPFKDRRQVSQGGLLDSAMRTIGQLITSRDLNTRALATRALSEIQQARRMVPARRAHDHKLHKP